MIGKIGVIGAGTMGAGIAAQAANAGIGVLLLDLVSGAAARALAAMGKTEPAAFMHKRNARLVEPGDLDADFAKLAGCDWIIEAIVENPQAKRALYARIDAVRKPGSVVSSNTSTIPLADLLEGASERFAANFMITHFFNPPRYMRLLEIVPGQALPELVAKISEFSDRYLGKTVVTCRDTPGFIANRIGTLWMSSATRHAIDLGLTVEEADAVAGRPFGVPKTGVFGLLDLVGIDLGPHISKSLLATLPADDAYRTVYRDEPLIARMIAEGRIGRKGKGGFYMLKRDGGARVKFAVDFATGEYRPSVKARLESVETAGRDLRQLAEHPDRGGRYARAMLLDLLGYAASLVPEIADTVDAVDAAMRLGYNWKHGPFELIDRVGAAWLANALRNDGRPVPAFLARLGEGKFYRVHAGKLQAFGVDGAYADVKRPDGVLLLADVKRTGAPLAKNGSASLWDLGDGVGCFEVHTKMNALDPEVMALLGKTVSMGRKGVFQALVIYNEGEQFSVGANVGLALFAANIAAWGEIETMIESGQKTYRALRDAPFPVVGAPAGMALGGGCEMLLHCDAVVAHAETYMGLVEVGVGLVPGWGGCAAMLSRWSQAKALPKGPIPPVAKTFESISTASVSKSAAEAQDLMFLRPGDEVVMNRDRLLASAKTKAMSLIAGYAAKPPAPLRLPGATGRAVLGMAVEQFAALGKVTPHDRVVCTHLANVLTGGDGDFIEDSSDEKVAALERRAFMDLLKHPATLARIEHMLETGKPLRN